MKTHKFTLNAGVAGREALVMIDDLDLTDCCRSFSVETAFGELTVVTLTLYGQVESNISCTGLAQEEVEAAGGGAYRADLERR